MPSNFNIDWKGQEVTDLVLEASRWAIDETMAAAVTDAKTNVPVRTATLQGSIRLTPSVRTGNSVTGVWGSFDVNYALAVETGNRSLIGPEGSSSRESGPARGPGKNTGNKNFFRNAADKEYPKLNERIAKRLNL